MLAAWLCCLVAAAQAQSNVVFEAKTDAREVVQGTSFTVSFELYNTEGGRFKAPDFGGLKPLSGPSQMRSVSIVNGKTSSRQSWNFEVEASHPGAFTIGPAAVSAGNQVYSSKPLTITVVAPRNTGARTNAPPPGASDELFIAAELDHDKAYPGQQVTYKVKIYTLIAIDDADIIGLPDFQGFYHKEKQRFDNRVQYQQLRGKKYAVKTLHEEAIFPQEKGELVIGPAKVRVGISQPGPFGSFLGGKPTLLQSQPVKLSVKSLPDPSPERFTGGVGLYSWECKQDKDTLTTDGALTLTFHLRGNGDARRFAPPKLSLPAGLEGFDPRIVEEQEYENGIEVVHTKILEYVVIPKEPGVYTFSPELCFFDPDSARYRTLHPEKPVTLHVTAGKNYRSRQSILDSIAHQPPLPAPKPKLVDLFLANWTIPAGLLCLACLLLTGLLLWKRKRNKPVVTALPPVSYPKIARQHFNTAGQMLQSGNTRAFYDELLKSLEAYLTAAIGFTPAQMTPTLIGTGLAQRNVPPSRIQAILKIWQTCEEAIFAAQLHADKMQDTWRLAEESIKDLEKIK
jgi:hypothetical protein